jgi:trans-2,3-dihydro-3-hydroxyanthranilate isomerase
MARSYPYLHYDVFTDHLFGGNQLAVVLDGRGLSDRTMQAIANEMNFSETTFVLPPERPDTDARMRIFTPAAELPMAGHPTVGSAFALARAGVIEPGRDRFVFGLGAGPTPVSLLWNGDELSFVWMTQQNPVFSGPVADRASAARLLGVRTDDIIAHLPVQEVSCAVPFLMVPLVTRHAVDRAATTIERFDEFKSRTSIDAHGVFLFSPEAGPDNATVYSRMFAPELGIVEDPATGSASGPLGCYLIRHEVVQADRAGAMLSLQGAKMGRPSHVHISVSVEHGSISSVRVGGQSVLAGEGTLYV